MTILVTGSTGHLGRLVIDALLRDGTDPEAIVAGARDVSRVSDLVERGVRAARLDYDDPSSVTDAMRGVERVVLISGTEFGRRVAQHSTVVAAAAASGVELLAYTSAPAARTTALAVAPEHKATEEIIEASGVPAVILRNAWYHENYLGAARQAAESGAIVSSAGDGRVASAARADYADAVAATITDLSHAGQVYELSGDTAWDFAEFAALVEELSGRPVTYRPVSPEEHVATLVASGMDEGTAGFIVAMDGNIRDGLLGVVTGDLARLIGRPTTPLRDTLSEVFSR
jgi:NAD(P)H dehydrogenase (quinone)